jgi:translation initiation factor eIF-2B subunit delta
MHVRIALPTGDVFLATTLYYLYAPHRPAVCRSKSSGASQSVHIPRGGVAKGGKRLKNLQHNRPAGRLGTAPMHVADAEQDGPRHVITAFLWDGRRILLALRSESVSTYPNHWAGISGYLEGDDPIQWGLVEIAEECGVGRTHLSLMKTGPTTVVEDESGRPIFCVHPMLFLVDDPSLVRHDWEARRFEWVEVQSLTAREWAPVVPKLYEVFGSVWPPWPPAQAIEANCRLAVAWVRQDRHMGASQLARVAAMEAQKLIRLAAREDFQRHKRLLHESVLALQAARPAMASPVNMMADVLADLKASPNVEVLLESVDNRLHEAEAAEKTVAWKAAEVLDEGCRVMTISYSDTVLRALQRAGPRLGHVYVCESRPLMEGRQLAQGLHNSKVPVTLLTDAQAFSVMPSVDCVLVGADAVLHNRDAVNKAGSALLALAARRFDKPFYVAANSLKWERQPNTVRFDEANADEEVWSSAPEGVKISNLYFDRIPRDLITLLISEHGPAS